MPTVAALKKVSPQVRRRNLWLGWILTAIVLAIAAWTYVPIKRGWIYPANTTYKFPHWMKK